MTRKITTNQDILNRFLEMPATIPFSSPVISFDPLTELLLNEQDGSFYFYKAGAWHLIPPNDLRTGAMARLLDRHLSVEFPQISATTARVIDLYHSLARNFPVRYSDPSYAPYSALTDQTLNLRTGELTPHNPSLFCFHFLPFHSSALSTPTPHFDSFLTTAFPNNPDMHNLIYEMIAFYLLPRTDEPATFFLYGKARTGKSTLLRLLTHIINPHFISSFSLQSLTNSPFTLAELANKRVNILDEDESDYIKADKLKALVSNTPLEACRKYQQPFTFTPKTKFLFSSNQFPKISNVDDGMLRRLHFIEFEHPVAVADQDKNLHNKLISEAPGIISKALTHGKRFFANNQEFSITPSMEQTKNDFLLEATPALRFFDEHTVISDTRKTSNQAIYDAYKEWCIDNGNKPLNSNNFFKQISTAPGIKTIRIKDQRYKNIILRSYETS